MLILFMVGEIAYSPRPKTPRPSPEEGPNGSKSETTTTKLRSCNLL